MDKYASIIEHKVTPKDDIENHQTKSTVGNQKQISNAFSEILKYIGNFDLRYHFKHLIQKHILYIPLPLNLTMLIPISTLIILKLAKNTEHIIFFGLQSESCKIVVSKAESLIL